ncbi:penicillin-binding protein 1B [Sessilibacter sp. MAH1]
MTKAARKKSPAKSRSKKTKRSFKQKLFRFFLYCTFIFITVSLIGFAIIDYTVTQKFDGRKWALAARVYARPLEIYPGANLTIEMLKDELSGLSYRFVANPASPQQAAFGSSAAEIYLPARKVNEQRFEAQKIRVEFANNRIERVTSNGKPLTDVVLFSPMEIGAIYPATGEDRILVRLQEIPPLLGEALIAVEDKNFVNHHGISLKSIARAILANLQAGQLVQGGSTITQQLVKNLYLSNERSLTRKLLEAAMTISLELHYSKAEILETYINEVYLGQAGRRAIHGFALASKFYFNKSVDQLNTEEIALLVGMVKGASYYNPKRHPERAKNRRDTVLTVMADNGLIEKSQAEQLAAKKIALAPAEQNQHAFPSFIDVVKEQLLRDYQLEDLQSEGLQIYTTLAPSLQRSVEKTIQQKLSDLERSYSITRNTLQSSAVFTAVGSGEILAVVGDRNTSFDGFNRALNAKRPIGSLIKPAVYLTALESRRYTLATPLDDSPVNIVVEQNKTWQPQNFDHQSHGQVPLFSALANSYNQSAARLGMDLGVDRISSTVKRLGIDAEIPQVPALILGSLDLTTYQMSNFYHTIANDGIYTPLRAIRSIYTPDGKRLQRFGLESKEVVASENAYLLDFALQINAHQGTGKSIYNTLPESLAVAGKTGTTNDQRDSWFAGYSGDLLGVVWVGADDNQPLPLTGSTGALNIWKDVFRQVPTRGIEKLKPARIDFQWVDAQTGLISGPNCKQALSLPFIDGTEPSQKARCEYIQTPVKPWWRRILGGQ